MRVPLTKREPQLHATQRRMRVPLNAFNPSLMQSCGKARWLSWLETGLSAERRQETCRPVPTASRDPDYLTLLNSTHTTCAMFDTRMRRRRTRVSVVTASTHRTEPVSRFGRNKRARGKG